jgi:RHS repeat-associated protein
MKRLGLITVPAVCIFILVLMFSLELGGIGSSSPGNSRENPDKKTDKKISLNLITPNGEELLHAGEKFLITWESDPDIEKVNLEYSPDNGTSFYAIGNNISNVGSYEWQIPYHVVSNCIVRISKADKRKMMPHQLSYEMKFKISGDESLNNSGEIFTISVGDENEKAIWANHSHVKIDDVAVRGLYKKYNKKQFITFFKEDFERFIDGKITMDSGFTKSIRKTSENIQFEGEARGCLVVNQDPDSGLRTLNIQAEQGSVVTLVKYFDVPKDIPYDISENHFAIREKGDMNGDALVQNQMKGSPGHSSQGTFTNGSKSIPSTLSDKSHPGLSRPKDMVNMYYIYTFDGKLLAEYDHDGNCVRNYIYFGDRLIAEYRPQTDKYYYYMTDQVNSTRIITDENGNVVYSEAYGPYGDVQKTWVNNYEPKLKFSGKEREGYSGLDYFGARYYNHRSYRFNSVDPIINRVEALNNPQLWNLYAYCDNNPVTFFDPDGRVTESMPMDYEQKAAEHFLKASDDPIVKTFAIEVVTGYVTGGVIKGISSAIKWGAKGIKWLKRLYKAKKLIKKGKWVKDAGSFVKWMKNIEKSGRTLTKAKADKIVKQARKYGVKVKLHGPHKHKKWNVPHLNIGKKGQAHVRVPKGYKLPD